MEKWESLTPGEQAARVQKCIDKEKQYIAMHQEELKRKGLIEGGQSVDEINLSRSIAVHRENIKEANERIEKILSV